MRDLIGILLAIAALTMCVLLMTTFTGCAAEDASAEWVPLIACESAAASLSVDSAPTPAPPAPDNGSAAAVGGPLVDTFRDAKSLVADARAILDQAKRDGEVVVKVQLPKAEAMAMADSPTCRTCPNGGRCPTRLAILPEYTAPEPEPTLAPRRAETPPAVASGGRRLGWRLRAVGQRVFSRGGCCRR